MITKQKKGFSNKIGEGNQVADLCLRLDYFAHMTSLHYFDNISASERIPLQTPGSDAVTFILFSNLLL